MNMKLLSFVAACVLGVACQVNAAAVFPTIDGGPYDGLQNNLGFTVSGTYIDADNSVSISDNDTFSLTYTLVSNGNASGPQSGFVITVDGTIANAASAGAFSGGDFTGTATLTGLPDMVDEINFTVVDGIFNNINGVGAFASAGLVRSAVPALIPPEALTFLPVSFATTPGFPSTTYDFVLETTGGNSSSLNVNFGSGTITGSARGAVNPIPEPASMLTLLGCVTGACVMGRRRRKAAVAA